MNDEITTIKIKKSTRSRILEYGKMGDTYDDALVKIMNRLDELENKEKRKQNPLEAQMVPALA